MTSAPNSDNYVDFDEYVGLKLEKTRSTIRTTDLFTTLAGVAAMFLGYLLVFVVLDQWAVSDGFSPLWRWILLSTLVISTFAWLILKVGIPAFQSVNGLFAAKEIEDSEPDLKGSLLNLIDLKAAGRPINPTILKALERQTALRLQKVNIDQAVDHRPLIRTAYLLLGIIVAFCVYAMLSPKKISNSIWRGLLPGARVAAATVTEIVGDVRPGDTRVPAHQPAVEIQVDIAGKTPEKVHVVYSTLDGKQDQEVELHAEEEGRYRGQLLGDGSQGLVNDVKYFVRAGDAKSRMYTITVEQPPYAEVETVRLEAPGYTKLPPTEQVKNAAIDAWEGTKVVVTAKTNMPVASAKIEFLDDSQGGPTGEEVPMSLSSGGRQVQGAWTLALRSDGSSPKFYRIHCKAEDGRTTTGHVNFPLLIKPDLPPDVALVQPDRDVSIPVNSTLSLLIQARDPDFELGYIYLNVEKDGKRIGRDQLSEGRQQKVSLRHDVAVSRWNPVVGDQYEVWIEAFDNKQPRPNSRNTPRIAVRIIDPVTPKEAEQQLADQKEKIDQQVAKSSPDLNQDQREPGQQRDGEEERRPESNEQEANQNEVAQQGQSDQQQADANQKGKKGKSEQGKSASDRGTEKGQQSGNGKSSDSSNEGGSKDQKSDGEQGRDQDQSLRNDGSQDFEALKKINDKLKNRQQQKPHNQGQQGSEGNSQQPERGDKQGQPPAEQPNSADNQQKGKPSSEQKKSEQKKGDKAEDQQGGNSESPQPDQEKSAEGDATDKKPERKSDQNNSENGSKDRKQEEKSKGESSKPNPDSKSDQQQSESGDQQEDGKAKSDAAKDGRSESNQKNETDGKKDQAADNKNPDSKMNPDSKGDQSQSAEGAKEASEAGKAGEKGQSKEGQKAEKKQADQAQSGGETSEASKEQAEDSPNSQKGEASGDEKGVAKPDRNADAKSKPMKNDQVTRDPNEKPEISPSDSQQGEEGDSTSDGQQKNEPGKSGTKSNQNSSTSKAQQKQEGQRASDAKGAKSSESSSEKEQASESDSASDDSTAGKPSDKADKPSSDSSKNSDAKSGSQSEKKSEKGGKGSSSDKSDSNSKDGESKSSEDSPSADKPSENKPDSNKSDSDQGAEKSSEQADSKKGSDSGGQQKSSDKQGGGKNGDEKPGEKSGSGKGQQKGNSSGEAPSTGEGEGGRSSGPKDGARSTPASKGSSGSSSSTDQKKNQPPESSDEVTPDDSAEPNGPNQKQSDSDSLGRADEANLEFNRQATELVLEKLQKELDRGDVDPDLLQQLGWSEADLKRFASRMSKSLQESKKPEDTPASKARQLQFEEMLKNLDLKGTGTSRSGEKEPKRDVQQIESKRTPPPAGYKSAFEKFTRDMNRQTPQKGKPATK